MLKSSTPRRSRTQCIQIPQVLQEFQDRSVRILSTIVDTLVLNNPLSNPWRDEKSGNTNTKTLEVEGDVLSILCSFGVENIVARGNVDGRGNMVSKSAVLVERQDEESRLPLRRVSDCFVNTLDEVLAESDWRRWVEGLVAAAFGVDVCELRESSCRSVCIELIKGSNVRLVFSSLQSPIVECRIGVKAQSWASSRVLVVHPGDSVLVE